MTLKSKRQMEKPFEQATKPATNAETQFDPSFLLQIKEAGRGRPDPFLCAGTDYPAHR